MRVECLSNQIGSVAGESTLGAELRRSVGPNVSSLDLSVGASYVVYAVEIRNGHPWYFVADDLFDSLSYPLAYASAFFRATDKRLSSCWNFGIKRCGDEDAPTVLIAFKEWIENAAFFERLIDGNDAELELFRGYKAFMDLEFPSPSVTDRAQPVEGTWIMCPKCSEAWESESMFGLLRCPNCNVMLLNPRYSPREPTFALGRHD